MTLFDTDAEKSVFGADIGTYPDTKRVCLYPRKSKPGWVWVLWGDGIATIGPEAIIKEGVLRECPVQVAASLSVNNAYNCLLDDT